MAKPQPTPELILQETDLREITRNPDICLTVVSLCLDWGETKTKWLVCGQSRLCRQRESTSDGRWRLEAYLPEGVTDPEHDSAYAFKLPLIGVQFEGVSYHQTQCGAWVDPNEPEDFRVPRPGFNPMEHPKAVMCPPSKYCEGNHIMVPEGFYAGPPVDIELYKAVAGKRIEILFSPVYPKEEEVK